MCVREAFWNHITRYITLQLHKLTLDLVALEDPEEPGGHEAELPLAGVRKRGDHLGHGRLPSNAGQAVVIREQEPGRRSKSHYEN